jgi:hypothetical protein
MLPILTVLFLISYGLMTMLIVEQGSTIESQRVLIRELFRDSTELAAVKGKAMQERKLAENQAQTQAHAPSAKTPSNQVQAPTTQTPSTQLPNHAPSSQVAPRRGASKTEQIQKPLFQAPPKPASDQAEDRRALIAI